MKAITLFQPWAELVARGIKSWETRSAWGSVAVNYLGQRIAIHAGKQVVVPAELPPLASAAIANALGTWDWPSLTRGAVVATARLVDVFEVVHLPRNIEGRLHLEGLNHGSFRLRPPHDVGSSPGWGERVLEPGEEHFGHFAPGRFLFRLEEVRRINPPIAARGYQQFWTWTPPNLMAVA